MMPGTIFYPPVDDGHLEVFTAVMRDWCKTRGLPVGCEEGAAAIRKVLELQASGTNTPQDLMNALFSTLGEAQQPLCGGAADIAGE